MHLFKFFLFAFYFGFLGNALESVKLDGYPGLHKDYSQALRISTVSVFCGKKIYVCFRGLHLMCKQYWPHLTFLKLFSRLVCI